jgi:hypothetical protein
VIRFERSVEIGWEHDVQALVVGSQLLVDAANAVYMHGHWPVLIGTGVLLYRSVPTGTTRSGTRAS